jgi:hypothetical protein
MCGMFSQTLFGAATEIVHTIPTLNGISHFRRPTAVGTRMTRATCFQQDVWLSDVHGVHQFFDGVVQRGGYYMGTESDTTAAAQPDFRVDHHLPPFGRGRERPLTRRRSVDDRSQESVSDGLLTICNQAT